MMLTSVLSRRSSRLASTLVRRASNLAHVVVKAEGATPTKTVVILHGILGNKGNWATFSRRIVTAFPQYQVIGVDHRAHGDSPSKSAPHHVQACAQDVIALLDSLNVSPDIVVGHSYGGKVALTYLDACRRQLRPVPHHTWVLDALPGCAQTDYATRTRDATFNSTDVVLPKLMQVPLPIASKKELVALLEAKGFDTGQAQWMTTNLRPVGDKFEWKMDLPVVDLLFKSFLATDCWPILEHPPAGADVHVVRAEYNKFWTPAVIHRFDAVAKQTSGRVHLHLLEKADHWVHVDNPQGLFALMQRSFKTA